MKTNNEVVNKITEMNLVGNMIPQTWYLHIKRQPKPNPNKKGIRNHKPKTDLLAVNILADLIYWYKASEYRDETTGKIIGLKKKFKEDKFHQYYDYWADMFGATKRQVQESVRNLEQQGIIKKEIRNKTTFNGKKLTGLTYLEPVPEKIYEITYTIPEEEPKTPLQNSKGGDTKYTWGRHYFVHPTESSSENSSETSHVPSRGRRDVECQNDSQEEKENFSDTEKEKNKFSQQKSELISLIKNSGQFSQQLVNQYKKQYSAGNFSSFNRKKVRRDITFDKEELWAALRLDAEGYFDDDKELKEFMDHEYTLWDKTDTQNLSALRGFFIVEWLRQSPIAVHFSLLTEEQKQKELKKGQKKPQGWTQEEIEAKLGRTLDTLEINNFMNEDDSFDGEGILRREGLTN